MLGTRPKAASFRELSTMAHADFITVEKMIKGQVSVFESTWLRDELDTTALLTLEHSKKVSPLNTSTDWELANCVCQPTDSRDKCGVENISSRQHSCDNFQLHTARCLHSIEGQCSHREWRQELIIPSTLKWYAAKHPESLNPTAIWFSGSYEGTNLAGDLTGQACKCLV